MLQVITGKPGAGKTYHAVNYLILPKIIDWCKFEGRKGERFSRKLYTNLPLDLDFIDNELCKRHNLKVKPSSYIELVELQGRFWESIPDDSLLAFDEVHHALGSEIEGELSLAWRNYVSTHRHHHHDIILLTQHIDNVTKDVLRLCEEIIDLQNIKTGRIPFFAIPLSDIYSVLKAWGYYQQTYLASYGRVVGKAIKYDGTNQTFTINKSDFGFYNTHAHGSQGSSDSPDLELGRIGSLLWFTKKHLFRVFIRIFIIVFVIYMFIGFINKLPETLSKNASFESSSSSKAVTNSSLSVTKVKKASDNAESQNSLLNDNKESSSIPTSENSQIQELVKTPFKILGIINNCVIFSNGDKLRVGDVVSEYDSEIIEIDSANGIVKLANDLTLYLK